LRSFTISKSIEFDAGHRVPNHHSKCKSPHGHRYKVEVFLTGDLVETTTGAASDEGMVADFGDLKNLMTTHIHDKLDHAFIVYEGDEKMLDAFQLTCYCPEGGIAREWASPLADVFDWKLVVFPYIPTAENIAKWCWEALLTPIKNSFDTYSLFLDFVKVWETPTSMAMYRGGY